MEQVPLPPAPSLGKSLTDVFASPADVFQSLKGTASAPTLWAIPLIVNVVLAILIVIVIFNDDVLRTQVIDQQRAAIEKRVDEGKITRQDADVAIDHMENAGSGMFIAIGSVAAIIFLLLAFFVGALFLWLADKTILKSPEGYGKHLELYGISSWIGILGGIVTVLMMVGLGSLAASPSAALAVLGSYDSANNVHKLLSSLNIFSIWAAAIIGIGLSKFSGKSTGAGMAVAFVLWILWIAVSILFGLGR
jgi:hypothetical protein